MNQQPDLEPIRNYFVEKLQTYGPTHKGVDYNSDRAQELRFDQLMKVFGPRHEYSLLDYGSGYGAMLNYLRRCGHQVNYYGYDIVEEMVIEGQKLFKDDSQTHFTTDFDQIPMVDYAVVSGTFNIKLETPFELWTELVVENITRMNERAQKGIAFNLLTKYSDPEYMRPDLYYADPCFFFDYCKRHFSKNVAVLHDYGLYDFTVLVRKDL
ncbi:MAG TPA: methyltransferase domain-containing protein [Anaerolineaceae bacterium]|nr:methyltransferase domain-containing protein [Anaerolineaceae bacterium]